MRMRFIINGEETRIDVPSWLQLGTARDLALEDTRNTGRASDEWELRHMSGVLLDVTRRVDFVPRGDLVFVTLRVGAGGATFGAAAA